MKRIPAIVLSVSFLFAACVQTVHYSTRDELFLTGVNERTAWRRLVVLPFTGEPAFRRVSGEWFSYKIGTHGLYEVVSPSLAEIELGRLGLSFANAAEIPLAEALHAGRLLGGDALVVGSIQKQELPAISHGPRVAGVSLIDLRSGKVVATSLRSKVEIPYNIQKAALASVDSVFEELLPALYSAAGRSWSPPVKTAPEHQEPWRLP